MACLDDFQKITVGAATVFHGSNLDVLPFMADNSVDSIICDPPYELGFMGKSWDSSGIAYSVDLWRECLRWADQEHRDQVEAMEAEEKETLF